MSRFYVTTAIDYANGDPHLGHAFEKIGADAIARYRRLRGDDVHFLVGMDEHGQKVATEAQDRGVSAQLLVDQTAERFQSMWQKLSISNNQFMRTTAQEHHAGVRALIEQIFQARRRQSGERVRGQLDERVEPGATLSERDLDDLLAPLA